MIKKIVTISALSSSILLAANLPNSSNIEKQIQSPRDIPSINKPSIKIDGLEKGEIVKEVKDGKKILIKGFFFSGNRFVDENTLQKLLKEYSNQELNFSQIQEILQKIREYYKEEGYFVARAYLEPQELLKNNNILKISILEGKYGEFHLKNSSLVKDQTLQDILDSIKDKDIISTNTIERATNLINSRAGAYVSKAVIKPGSEVGTSDFDIEVLPENRVNGYIVADNYGSRYTGYNRLQALVNLNSPFNIGDKLTFSGIVSNGLNLKNGKIAYELPLNSYGLNADFAYSRTNYKLAKEYKDLNIKGHQNIYEAGLSYPIIRTTNENLYIKTKYYHKDMKDYMKGLKYEDKTVNSLVTSVDYDKNYFIKDMPANLFANVNYTRAYLSSNGKYHKIDAYLSNIIYLNDIFSFNTILNAQKVLGHKSLDGSETISLGGATGVRLYPYSEQSAENGYIATFELFSKLPSISSFRHKIGFFYDIGDAYQEVDTDATFKRKTLQDTGIEYYINYKEFFLRLQMAWAINHSISDKNEAHQNSKFLFQTGMVF